VLNLSLSFVEKYWLLPFEEFIHNVGKTLSFLYNLVSPQSLIIFSQLPILEPDLNQIWKI